MIKNKVSSRLLSKNFTLRELTHTDTGLPNDPDMIEAAYLSLLARTLLQPIRNRWGRIKITSGFRCQAVNKKVGGNPESQHPKGEAADILPVEADINDVMKWIVKESGLNFGQCIIETVNSRKWIHISLLRGDKPNQVAMSYDGEKYKIYV